MTRNRRLFLTLADEFLACLAFIAIFGAALGVMSEGGYVSYAWLIIIPFYFLSAVRMVAKNLFVFVILNLMPFACLFLIPDNTAKAVTGMVLFGLFCYSLAVRVKERKITGGLFAAILPIAMAFLASLIFFISSTPYPGYFLILNVTLAFIAAALVTHVANVDGSLYILSLTSSPPKEQVFKANNRAIGFLSVMIAVAAVLSLFVRIDYILSFIGKSVFAFLRWVFTFFRAAPEPGDIPQENYSPLGDDNEVIPLGEPPLIMELVELILIILGYVLVFAILIYAAVNIVRFIYRNFYAKRTADGAIAEYAAPIYISVKERVKKAASKILPPMGKNARIRRLFQKKVKGFIKRGLSVEKDNTARIIKNKAAKYEDISELTKMYEQARYT